MAGIPPVLPTDVEDVVWALQTADALWKRGERADAIVWLRRAAQSAGEAEQDDRALDLARLAADLADFMSANPPSQVTSSGPPLTSGGVDELLAHEPPPTSGGVDELLGAAVSVEIPIMVSEPKLPIEDDEPATLEIDVASYRKKVASAPDVQARTAAEAHAGILDPWSAPPPLPPKAPTRSSPIFEDEEVVTSARKIPAAVAQAVADMPPPKPQTPIPPKIATPVPPKIDPPRKIATPIPPKIATPVPPKIATPAPPKIATPVPPRIDPPRSPAIVSSQDSDDVVTSASIVATHDAPPSAIAAAVVVASPPPVEEPKKQPPPLPKRPPPLPPKPQKKMAARRASRRDSAPPAEEVDRTDPPPEVEEGEKVYTTAPISLLARSKPPSKTPPPPGVAAPLDIPAAPPVPAIERPKPEATLVSKYAPDAQTVEMPKAVEPPKSEEPTKKIEETPRVSQLPTAETPALLDLDNVPGLMDLPDDERVRLVKEAEIHRLKREEEIGGFALAMVVRGEVDVSAQIVDAAADRLTSGTVLRGKGSLPEGVPLRLVCASEEAVVATWTAEIVDPALETCPWVQDDLRAQADRVQALVGVTLGPLADRLDASLRRQVVSKLGLRELSPGEVVVEKGQPVRQMLIVGQGYIDLVEGEDTKESLGAGDLLFPAEILGAGAAPITARAGKGGALVLQADRSVAQELMVTCPPLLEIFGGM